MSHHATAGADVDTTHTDDQGGAVGWMGWQYWEMTGSRSVVALLRGINVGGHNKLPMAQLRDIALSCGLTNPRTYIQSGNLVAEGAEDAAAAASVLREAIRTRTELDVSIVARTAEEWEQVVDRNPYPDVEPGALHVMFLPRPDPDAVGRFSAAGFEPDSLVVRDAEIYLHLPDGLGRSKLAETLARHELGRAGTVRNWKTVNAVAALIAPPSPH